MRRAGGVQCRRTPWSDDEHSACLGRAGAVAAAALLCFAGAGAAATKPNPHAALDCNYCHFDTPRFGVDTRDTVNFWRAEGDEPQLCERCHGPEANFHPLGVVPGQNRLGTRLPKHLPLGKSEAVRDQVVCITCHFVHAANADRALLRGFRGSDKPGLFPTWQDLCRECHGEGLEKRSPHAGDERSCAFCHSTKPAAGQTATVTPAGSKLCEFCHGFKGEDHYAGVNPYKEQQDCTGCHDPHLGKDRPARLKAGYFDPIRDAVTLNPHRKRTLCFACHADGAAGPPARRRRGRPLPALPRLREDPGDEPPDDQGSRGLHDPPGVAALGRGNDVCDLPRPGHPPGAVSGRPDEPAGALYLLRGAVAGDRTAVCFRCHAKSTWAGRNPHQEAARQETGCTLCHASNPE